MPNSDDHIRYSKKNGYDPKIVKSVGNILDSTANIHGPEHRKDPIHSLQTCKFLARTQGQEWEHACIDHLKYDDECDKLKESEGKAWLVACKQLSFNK